MNTKLLGNIACSAQIIEQRSASRKFPFLVVVGGVSDTMHRIVLAYKRCMFFLQAKPDAALQYYGLGTLPAAARFPIPPQLDD
ncbi:hypothetical protein BaRGS_00021854 [Batillaria attramentaria]|uniref:Uncharacterized protein n=1 Tax=Batillaria attramentaria TaxID=370345 RepID=A0ABD0KIG5_9CAEN